MPGTSASKQNPGQIPVHIEEDHHHVLEHILSGIGSKRLPFSGNALLHFDSHPDMLLPRKLQPALCMDKRALLDCVSIENWILPCAFLGVINKIVWVCPPWAGQIPHGLHRFLIGKHRESGYVRVTCTESYFLSEGITCREDELEDTKEVELLVHELGFERGSEKKARELADFLSETKSLILDVDLDFYSTKNPFLELHAKAGLYAKLKELYVFECVPDNLSPKDKAERAITSCQKRTQLLDELLSIFAHLDQYDDLKNYAGPGTAHLDQVRAIKEAIDENCVDEPVDWLLVHDAGCTCDNTDLPHHVSSTEEVSSLFERTLELLAGCVPERTVPKMVTVARSTEDDFCPKNQVEDIQGSLMKV